MKILASILCLVAISAAQQKDKPKQGDIKFTGQTSTISVWQAPPQASYTERITKDGHYLVTFDDPNREFICNITGSSPENRWEINTLTIVCMRTRTIVDEREVKH